MRPPSCNKLLQTILPWSLIARMGQTHRKTDEEQYYNYDPLVHGDPMYATDRHTHRETDVSQRLMLLPMERRGA